MTPEEWYRGLPPVTRVYWTAAVVATLLATIGAVSPQWLLIDFDLLIHKFQIWRFFSNYIFFGGFSIPMIFQVVILVRYLGMLEGEYYTYEGTKGMADLLFILLSGLSVINLLAYLFLPAQYFHGPALVFMIIYIWSRKDPYKEVTFYGFSFKCWHTPFLMLIAGMLMGGNPILGLLGISVGHMFYFLTELVPRNYNKHIYFTPKWWYDFIDYQVMARIQGRGVNMPANTAQPRPNWQRGQGYRLG